MNASIREIVVNVCLDETGHPEQLTWDLLPVIDPRETVHLDENGLPKLGEHLCPGMILVGKIGKSKRHFEGKEPTALELQTMSFEELKAKYAYRWTNRSVYVPAGLAGTVLSTILAQKRNELPTATITILVDESASGGPNIH